MRYNPRNRGLLKPPSGIRGRGIGGNSRFRTSKPASTALELDDMQQLAADSIKPRQGSRRMGKMLVKGESDSRYLARVNKKAEEIRKTLPTEVASSGDTEGRRRRRGIGGLQTPMSMRETMG